MRELVAVYETLVYSNGEIEHIRKDTKEGKVYVKDVPVFGCTAIIEEMLRFVKALEMHFTVKEIKDNFEQTIVMAAKYVEPVYRKSCWDILKDVYNNLYDEKDIKGISNETLKNFIVEYLEYEYRYDRAKLVENTKLYKSLYKLVEEHENKLNDILAVRNTLGYEYVRF